MELTRENLRSGRLRRQILESGVDIQLLSEAELDTMRRATLAAAAPDQNIWLFAYGSLIWNPAFHFAERRTARLHGYHRQFCLWTNLGRGTPSAPGLLLGLEPGGSCRGVAFRIAASQVEEETAIVWAREMASGSYAPRWVRLHTPRGPVPAIAFVMNREFCRYAGRLAQDRIVHTLASAGGAIGSCADYLFETVEHLEQLGIRDSALFALRDLVAARIENAAQR